MLIFIEIGKNGDGKNFFVQQEKNGGAHCQYQGEADEQDHAAPTLPLQEFPAAGAHQAGTNVIKQQIEAGRLYLCLGIDFYYTAAGDGMGSKKTEGKDCNPEDFSGQRR